MRCEKGTVSDNLNSIRACLQGGSANGADIMCFPEMSITGYIDPTRQPDAILRLDGPEIARFASMTRQSDVTAIAGLVEANPNGKPFITQVVAQDGKLVGFYRKINVAEDEVRWFAPGDRIAMFAHRSITFGLAICADIGKPEIFSESARRGARIVFEAAAPGLYGSQETRDWRAGYEWWRNGCHEKLGSYARENGIYIAVATQTGRTSDEDFPGGAYVFTPDGTCLAETTDWSEGTLYCDINP